MSERTGRKPRGKRVRDREMKFKKDYLIFLCLLICTIEVIGAPLLGLESTYWWILFLGMIVCACYFARNLVWKQKNIN